MEESGQLTKQNIKKLGPFVIKHSGPYGRIRCLGPVKSEVSEIIADSIKVDGPLSINDVTAVEAKINGPVKFNDAKFDTITVNGPTSAKSLEISNKGKFNGPVSTPLITGNTETVIKINGPVLTDKVEKIGSLSVVGKIVADTILVDDEFILSMMNTTEVKRIEGNNIEIGRVTNNHRGFVGKILNRVSDNTGSAIIDEIHARGVVELDNVQVRKITAKEVFAGDNVEIGEFIQIQ